MCPKCKFLKAVMIIVMDKLEQTNSRLVTKQIMDDAIAQVVQRQSRQL